VNRREALAQVAEQAATLLGAADFEEVTGVREEDVSKADAERLAWAAEEVQRRIRRMGTR
jgi:hypothetical protein